MENKGLIDLLHVCSHYEIELSFVYSLREYGLIQIIKQEEGEFIEEDDLNDIEKLMRLHYELDINMAGLDAIQHLLKRLRQSQQDILRLQNRLHSEEKD